MMTISTRKYFEKAGDAEQRGASDPLALQRYADDICKYLGQCQGKKVLDIGCGDGKTMQLVAQETGAQVIGVDFAYPLLARCGGDRVCADAVHLPFKDKTFDIVYSFSFLQYFSLKSYKSLMAALSRVLKIGGKIYHLSVPDRRHFWKHDRFPRCFISRRPWRSPLRFLRFDYQLSIDGSYWWNRKRILVGLPRALRAECFQSDECWYRMNVVYEKMG